MKKTKFYLRLISLIIVFIAGIFTLKSLNEKEPQKIEPKIVEKPKEPEIQVIEKPTKPLSVKEKKQRFKDLLVPAVDLAYSKLDKQYKEIKELLKTNANDKRIEELKKEYKAKSNQDLLYKLKPHPKSVTLAQAAIESAWGTSRFFYKANNVFGVWSFNKSEPRIAAGETRGEKTIYLKKYRTIEESVLDYYKTLAKGKPYHKFRVQNYTEANPYILVTHLDSYSEKRAVYGKILISVIGHNKFVEYDEKFYPRPPKEKKKKPEIKKEEPKIEPKKVQENQDLNISIYKDTKENIEEKILDTNSTQTKKEIKKELVIEDENASSKQ